jgi:hypothetical protein
MDSRKLGWLALGIGVIALIFSIGGNMRSRHWYDGEAPRYAPAAPVAPAAPEAPPAPRMSRGDFRNDFRELREDFREFRGPFSHHENRFGPFRSNDRPPLGLFFGFKLLGTLVRSALFLLILFMLVRWFGRRKETTPPSNPDQGSYTSGTQAL